jgi:hypothetical protein
MGVEFYITCLDCKQYIDIHKAYRMNRLSYNWAPPSKSEDDLMLNNPYWDSRGTWFLWKHVSHKIKMRSDAEDSWWQESAYFTEVFPYYDEEKRIKNDPKL